MLKRTRILYVSIVLMMLIIATVVPTMSTAQKNDDEKAVKKSSEVKKEILWEDLQAWGKEQKILNEQKVKDSVNLSYKKQKDKGSIPVISGPTTLNIQRGPSQFSSEVISPLSTTTYYRNDYDFGMSYIYYSFGGAFQRFDTSTGGLKNMASVIYGPAGGVDAWGWTGSTFTWNGPSGNYNIAFHGYKDGYTSCYGAYATASTQIDCVVQDHQTGATNYLNDYSKSFGGFGYESPPEKTINRNFVAYLEQGHTYSIYEKIDSQAIVWSFAGEAVSNFYDGRAGLWFYYVDIT